jgi:hypothetical protein
VTSPSKKSKERGQICENFRYRASYEISRLVNGEPAGGLFMGLNPGLYTWNKSVLEIKIGLADQNIFYLKIFKIKFFLFF